MRVEWTDVRGVVLEAAQRHEDARGSFEKLYDGSSTGPLTTTQLCTSFNRRSGTVRGLHVQVAPHLEHKAVWCGSGEIFDVLLDTRPGEPTFGCWVGVRLSGAHQQLLRVPPAWLTGTKPSQTPPR
jgi:dTDP-4-dehydrorhamnose 3,5-epimerase